MKLKDGALVETWQDASGHHRDLAQPSKNSQPIFHGSFVRFDGGDDFLAATNLSLAADELTIFVVAAPRSNAGFYRAILSANESGKNDYATGINLDQGGESRTQFDRLNVEGAGFGGGGGQSLLKTSHEFGTFHLLALTVTSNSVKLRADGRAGDKRARTAGKIQLADFRLGSRFFSNNNDPARPAGFFDGDVAEVLVFGRALADEERASVEEYLRAKHARLLKMRGLPPTEIVRVLAGGFTVRELPVELTHINALRYAPDGRLFAAGYDGRIHVLRDTDGDGLEDRVEPFWYERTLRTPISICPRPEGLYVASNGKISLLRDGKEEIVASGWVKDDGTTGGAVDALGLAFDKDNNLYFGIGCADYSNPYRVKDGVAHYDIRSERGTIQKVSPDRKRRETFATGIRFSYTLAFNRLGDLFETDQEGATWLPNGNPLDELNHIIAGRHYGFPPRHEKFLPDVLDEPAVVEFGPQHQSSCGLVFNEPSAAQKLFGPRAWDGDAFVALFSRGKIARVRLVKTPSGYVGKSYPFISSRMLSLDTAISPVGDLVFCTHSGDPDWGTGPQGKGRLFKISFTDSRAPQPVATWASSPMEVRVAFDRPLDSAALRGLRDAKIEFGEYVRAADRFEVLKPPYEAVQAQMRAYRGLLRIADAKLSADKRTLILATDPHPARATYALTLPNVSGATVDLDYVLNGVEAKWQGDGANWSGWLPHFDTDVNRALTAGSTEHERLEKLLAVKGELALRTKLLFPAGKITLRVGEKITTLNSNGEPMEVALSFPTGAGFALHASFHTNSDPTERPIPLERFLLPWSPPPIVEPSAPSAGRTELAGGDWKRGEQIFFGDEAKCGTCHAIRGVGGRVGPDLSNLSQRDVASILRDITEPNATINPDYVAYNVTLRNGDTLNGLVRAESAEKIRLVNVAAQETVIAMKDVASLTPSAVSIMPEGFKQLGNAKLRDLLLFLTSAAPPYRSRAEVEKFVGKAAKGRPLNIVLVASEQDHGPAEHDYPAWQRYWKELLAKAPDVTVSTAWKWPKPDQWQSADLVLLYFWNHDWSAAQLKDLDDFLARGGGLIVLHSATIHDKDAPTLAQRIGLAAQVPPTKYRHGALDLKIVARDNPITRGLSEFHLVDETYWPMVGDASKVEVLASATEEGKDWPMIWTHQVGKGKVFCSILGHYAWTLDDPLFRVLVLRGMAWAAGEPTERFGSLVTEGAELR